MTRTSTRVTIRPEERDELHALAQQAGISLSEAMRQGARLILGATSEPREYRRGRPPKEARAQEARAGGPALPEELAKSAA